MRIGLDFDGVISDCGELKRLAAQEMYGLDVPADRFKKELLIGDGVLTLAQYRDIQKAIYGTLEFGMRMVAVDGVVEGIGRLRDAGHELRVITSRSGDPLEVARTWCDAKGIDLPFTGVGYDRPKTAAAKGFDVFVDDDLDKLEPLIGEVPHLFLFSWGYNAHVDVGSVADRVASWTEFVDVVEGRDRERRTEPRG